jgi:hypothetical protein
MIADAINKRLRDDGGKRLRDDGDKSDNSMVWEPTSSHYKG